MFKQKYYLLTLVVVLIIIYSIINVYSAEINSKNIKTADDLTLTYIYENINQAIMIYEDIYDNNPDNYELCWKLSRAYNAILDIKTNQAIITVEGLTDTEENKKLWREFGKNSFFFSEKALEFNPDGVEGLIWNAISYAYYSSSYGIVKAIFSGAAKKFKKNAKLLIDNAPEQMGALGYRHMGIFYLAAPFPIGSASKAAKYMQKALSLDSKYLQNHYYFGLALYRLEKYKDAKREFDYVIQNPPQVYEKHCNEAFMEESKRFIELIKRKK
ncbi:MAG: hypothetical protein ABII27_06525 [bacterium]